MPTAIYVRVSSRTQIEASQLPDLGRWVMAQAEPVDWYRDKFTGTTFERAGWERLWADVLAGKLNRIVVWRLDRLGRTASGLTALFDELLARGVTLVSIRDGFDLLTSSGRLHARILASVCQYETEVRSERQLAGIEQAKARGVKFGRKPVGKGNGTPLKVTPEQEVNITRLLSEGQTKTSIARATGLSRRTVYEVLRRLAAAPA